MIVFYFFIFLFKDIINIIIMNKYIILFTQLPTPIKLSSYFYIGSLLIYNGIGTYFDAKQKLIAYREDKLSENEHFEINDEWTAVKYGANEHFAKRLFDSIIWPVKTITNIIPFIVLQLNPKPSDTLDDTKK